jgi:hypothetical protein
MTTELFGVSAGQRMAAEDQARGDLQAAMTQLHLENAAAQRMQTAQSLQAQQVLRALASGQGTDAGTTMQGIENPSAGQPTLSTAQALAMGANSPGDVGMLPGQAPPQGQGGPPPAQQIAAQTMQQFAKQGQLADYYDRAAQALAKAGLAQQSEAYAKTAAELRFKQQQVLTEGAQAEFRRREVLTANLSEINALASGVTDEASFNRAKMIWMSNHPGQPIPVQFQVYDPAMIEGVKKGTKEGLEKLKLEKEQADAAANLANKQSQDALRQERIKYLKIQEEKANDAATKAGKAGSTNIASPQPADIAQAASRIKADHPDLPADEMRQAAFNVAAAAKALQKQGIDAGTALDQAYAAEAGNFAPVAKASNWFDEVKSTIGMEANPGTRTGYKRGAQGPAAAASAPLPLPAPEDRKVGTTYTVPAGKYKGKQGVWTGQGLYVKD